MRPDRSDTLANTLGVSGLYLFALSGGFSTSGISIGLLLMTAALLPQWRTVWQAGRQNPLLWAALGLIVYLAASTWWAAGTFPETADQQQRQLGRLLSLTGLYALPVAWWIGGDARRLRHVLALALAGLVIGYAINLDWRLLGSYFEGERASVYFSANATGLYAAAGLYALLFLILFQLPRLTGSRRWLAGAALALLGAAFALVVVWSQSRSAWVALALVFPPTLLWLLLRGLRDAVCRRSVLVAAIGMLVLTGAILLSQGHIIEQRATEEQVTLDAVSRMELDALAEDNIGLRIGFWRAGLERFAERPLFGWGPGSSRMLLDQSDNAANHGFPHHHNLILELLVASGLVGTAGFLLVFLLFARSAWRSRTETGAVWVVFLAGLAALYLIASQFNIRLDTQGRFYVVLLGALACTHGLRRGARS